MEESLEYYSLLDKFIRSCEQLVDRGQSYFAILLCHELYRFLYPIEPYARFTHERPVEFITTHITRLIELAEQFSATVNPYPVNFEEFVEPSPESETLETSTSNVYSSLWKEFDTQTLTEESVKLLGERITENIIDSCVVGKKVLDMGCGSGRYTIALAKAGAGHVTGIDLDKKSFRRAEEWCRQKEFPVEFHEGNFHNLPFEDNSFDFVFCNGTLHHSSSISRGLQELRRVLKPGGVSFLYLYATGGIFWTTRRALREVFKKIPMSYTKLVLRTIGLPSNRFIFCDTWYVPVESHTARAELESILGELGFSFRKLTSRVPFDLDKALEDNLPGGREMWGEGDHRYLLEKN
jgi:ubiquinone/menaquinone biosynthesis C-methylase UbiE